MYEIIERTNAKQNLWEKVDRYNNKAQEWETVKTVCIVSGLSGCGKTTLLLHYFRSKKVFYFSFNGLDEITAERLLLNRVSEVTGKTVSDWNAAFTTIAKHYKYVIFDDVAALTTYKRFHQAFCENMITNIHTRPFVVFLEQPNEVLGKVADNYSFVKLDYFSVPDIIKMFPKLLKIDILGLSAISGGVPNILLEYDPVISFTENLHHFLKTNSAFIGFLPELLSKYFRRPESYHLILHAIANGNHRVSEIGKFTGFAYNKCDNYLSVLTDLGFISAEKEKEKNGIKKTAYRLKNSYFRLWYRYMYLNQTALRMSDKSLIENIVNDITEKEIHAFHLDKAFAYVNDKLLYKLWASFRIKDKIGYAPGTVQKGKFSYTFDAIARNGGKAVFVKVFEDTDNNCNREEWAKIQQAVMLTNKYYDSHIFIFSKRRFSDHAVYEAARDDCVNLVEVERLKF